MSRPALSVASSGSTVSMVPDYSVRYRTVHAGPNALEGNVFLRPAGQCDDTFDLVTSRQIHHRLLDPAFDLIQ
jgi:hypothetical protein